METLYNKCAIRPAFDTIRINLNKKLLGNDPQKQLIKELKDILDPDDYSIFQDGNNHHVKDRNSKRYITKIYKTGEHRCMVEIFGMCQTYNKFKLNEDHIKILSTIGNLQRIEKTLEKADVAFDYLYPHSRSFIFDGKFRSDILDFLKYQMKFPFVHLTDIPMTTIRVPNRQISIKKYVMKHMKSPENKKHGESYYRWVKPTSIYKDRINYKKCERSESKHFEIKVNDRKLLYKLMDFFDGSETFDSAYNHETDTHISRGKKKVSNISYDKPYRDDQKSGGADMSLEYGVLVKEFTDNDEEHDDLLGHFALSRFESRLYRPAVSTRQHPLDLTTEESYDKLLAYIKKQFNKNTIFILKSDVSTEDYLNLYRERLRKFNTVDKITPDDYGRILQVNWDNLDNQIKILKSFFI